MPISRRDFLGRLAAGAAAAATADRLTARELDRPMPNLVWIMTDQQPVNTIRAYGNPRVRTPLSDGLARAGTTLTNFHISAFPCGPSRSCLLTARECHNTRVVQNDVTLPDEVQSIAEILGGSGYRMGYFGKYHLGGNMYRGARGQQPFGGNWQKVLKPSEDGFAYEEVPGGSGEDGPVHGFTTEWAGGWAQYHAYLRARGQGALLEKGLFGNHNCLPSGPEGQHLFSRVPAEHHVESFIAQSAAAFVRSQAKRDRPFGAVVSFYGPHLPVAPPQPWDELYGLDLADLPANHQDSLEGKPIRQRTNDRCYVLPRWGEEQFRDYVRRYWGFVGYLEQCAQQIVDAVEETGVSRDTIVLWTSDHGDMVAAHGMVFKLGACGYEELLNVPFLIRYPGVVQERATSAALCSTVDLTPTLLELMGVPLPENLDGRSFKPVLTGESRTHRDVVVSNWMENGLVVRSHEHKLVFNHHPRDIDEVYDLTTDPGELHNLAAGDAGKAIATDLQGRLDDWLTTTHHPFAGQVATRRTTSVWDSLCQARPEVTEFKHLGGDQFELTYVWHVDAALKYDQKCWCFCQFVRPGGQGDQAILFRSTDWPEPPTTAWKAGDSITVGPLKLKVPDGVQGTLTVRMGLYDPQHKAGPGTMYGPGARGNAYDLYDLVITREGGQVKAIELKPKP